MEKQCGDGTLNNNLSLSEMNMSSVFVAKSPWSFTYCQPIQGSAPLIDVYLLCFRRYFKMNRKISIACPTAWESNAEIKSLLCRGSAERTRPGPRRARQCLHSQREEELIKAVTQLSSPKLKDKEEGEVKSPGNYLILHLYPRGNVTTVTVTGGPKCRSDAGSLRYHSRSRVWFVSLASVPQRNLTKTSMLEVGTAVCCFPSSALFAIRSVTFAFPFILVRR